MGPPNRNASPPVAGGACASTVDVLLRVAREPAGALERAEVVLGAFVGQLTGAMPGIDGHPTDGVDRQAFVAARSLADGEIERNRCCNVAQLAPAALLKHDPLDVSSRFACGFCEQHLVTGGLG